jgi:hypothetical protein
MRVPRPNSTLKVDSEKPLGRNVGLARKPLERKARPHSPKPSFTPASKAQREKVRDARCLVTGQDRFEATIDFAHLWPRSKGGCDDPLCGVPLVRMVHRDFDDGKFDLLPYLRPSGDHRRFLPELQHMVEHADGDLVAVLERLTGHRVEWRQP